jgi:hypothetical protein
VRREFEPHADIAFDRIDRTLATTSIKLSLVDAGGLVSFWATASSAEAIIKTTTTSNFFTGD